MTDRRYEQGGVVNFVVIAVVLALLLVGGIWLAKRPNRTTAGVNSPSDSSKTSNDTKKEQNSSSKTGGDDSVKNKDSVVSSGGAKGVNGSSNQPSSSGNALPVTEDIASAGPSVDEIPSTGPVEVIATVLMMSAGGAGTHYLIQSRKSFRSSALK